MIITVASFKGGVGKTTTAVHLAALLHESGPTLLVDGDPNRSATGWGRRGSLPFRVVDERQAPRFVGRHEHVVIDTQARPSREDLQALALGCDLLLLPSTPDALALDALLMTVSALRELQAAPAPADLDGAEAGRLGIVLTMIPPRPSRDGAEAQATLREAGLPVCAAMIRRAVAFQKAALQGVPVHKAADPRAAAAWDDYLLLAREVLPADILRPAVTGATAGATTS